MITREKWDSLSTEGRMVKMGEDGGGRGGMVELSVEVDQCQLWRSINGHY